MHSNLPFEKLGDFTSALGFPIEDNGILYVVSSNGDISTFNEGKFKVQNRLGGQPSSIAFDHESNNMYIADMAHQAILVKQIEEKNNNNQLENEIISQNEQDLPFIGPNSLIISLNLNALFFTDSGPFGETTNENPRGSVYIYEIDNQQAKHLALNCLAYPSGLALSNDEKSLFVCETCKNRVLRFVLTGSGGPYFSVLYQFSGRFGPSSVAVSHQDLLYVARYEFSQVSNDGMISVVNQSGQLLDNFILPGLPEISGIAFSITKPSVLFITENATQSCCCVLVHQDEKDESKKKGELSNHQTLKNILK